MNEPIGAFTGGGITVTQGGAAFYPSAGGPPTVTVDYGYYGVSGGVVSGSPAVFGFLPNASGNGYYEAASYGALSPNVLGEIADFGESAMTAAPNLVGPERALTESELGLLRGALEGDTSMLVGARVVSVFATPDNRAAFVVGGTIFVRRDVYSSDFSTGPNAALLVHEGAHLQQFATMGLLSVVVSSTIAQSGWNGGYDYSSRLGERFASLNVEQQAAAITDRYLLRVGGRPYFGGNEVTLNQLEALINR